jgi:flavin reductase (DIM6/NTAB) family NADH-FMN oxidoreductase RutF
MAKVYTEHDRRLPKTQDEAFPTPGYLPVSAVMVSVADLDSGVPNIIPLTGWGFLNRLPLMLGIAINTTNYNKDYYIRGSLEILRKTMDFVLNVPTEALRDKITGAGSLSRYKDPTVNKFKELGLTPGPGKRVKSPHIVECPINFECVVRAIVPQGSHDLFLGEVVGCFTDGKIIDCGLHFGEDHVTMQRDDGSLMKLVWQTLIKEEKA